MDLAVGTGPSRALGLYRQPWTLVTFYDKDLLRTVNVEWILIVMVLLILYAGVYVVICFGVLLVRPKYRAPWLWPDPSRSCAYLDALPVLLILAVTFAVAIAVLAPEDLIVVGALLPFLAWVVTYRALGTRRNSRRLAWTGVLGASLLLVLLVAIVGGPGAGWRGALVALLGCATAWTVITVRRPATQTTLPLPLPVNKSYGLAAGLLLLLITVMPAAAFFKVSYDTVLESFIKYGQLQIALDRSQHVSRADEIIARRIDDPETQKRVRALRNKYPKWWGGYDTFFFCTRPPDYKPEPPGDPAACPAVAVAQKRPATNEAASIPKPAAAERSVTVRETVEELLPFYSDSSVWFRELVHDRASDDSWSWERVGADLLLRMPGDRVAFTSIKPPFIEKPGPDPSFVWNALLLALIAIAAAGAIAWVARFVIRSVFVVDVIEPVWSGSVELLRDFSQPHLFIVSREQTGDERLMSTCCEVDFGQAPATGSEAEDQWFGDQLDALARAAPGETVLIRRFEHRTHDRDFNEMKLSLLERVLQVSNRPVIVISAVPPGAVHPKPTPGAAVDENETEWNRRWTAVFSRFIIIPARPVSPVTRETPPVSAVLGDWPTAGWREIAWRLNALGFAHSTTFLDDERRDPVLGRLWKDILPYAWGPDRPPLDVRQLIAEVGERAENYYREIWDTCTASEKLVLGQVADQGLVNEKTKKTARLLMARGLVRRQPHFTLMNETFRQFVLSPQVRDEVVQLEEQSSGAWDTLKWPFLIILVASLGFFFATQQELFKTVLGALTAAATLIPVIVKLASGFGERRTAS
jgi:hypothetical protein